jgi:hypothetical protein
MEEPRKEKVIRIQCDGVSYVKNSRGFLWNEKKNKEGKPYSVGYPVAYVRKIDDKYYIFKKRVNLVFTTKQGKYMEITSSLETLDDLIRTYERSDKSAVLMAYKTAKRIINEITMLESPTVDEAYKLIMAVRSSLVISSIITDIELPICCVTCSVCKKEDKDSTFKKCGACKKVYYCSSECNKLAWAEHKKVCKAIMCCEEWL